MGHISVATGRIPSLFCGIYIHVYGWSHIDLYLTSPTSECLVLFDVITFPCRFVAHVTVNNDPIDIATASGKTKKEAKRLAADNAVKVLMQLDAVS